MATTNKGLADRAFDAMSETTQAAVERVRAGNERAYRVATAVIREAEWTAQEALGLGRQLVTSPADVLGNTGALYQKSVEAQERALEFGRQLVDELVTATRETRGAAERVARANLELGQPAVEAVQSFAERTRQVIRPGMAQVTQAATRATRRVSQSEEAA
jgi:hypothetical protein